MAENRKYQIDPLPTYHKNVSQKEPPCLALLAPLSCGAAGGVDLIEEVDKPLLNCLHLPGVQSCQDFSVVHVSIVISAA